MSNIELLTTDSRFCLIRFCVNVYQKGYTKTRNEPQPAQPASRNQQQPASCNQPQKNSTTCQKDTTNKVFPKITY